MGLSPGIALDIVKAAEDQEITTSEVESMMTGVFNAGITGMVLVFMATQFVKATNPPKKTGEDIMKIAEML